MAGTVRGGRIVAATWSNRAPCGGDRDVSWWGRWLSSPELAAAKPWLPTCAQQDRRWLDEHADILGQQRAGVALAEHVAARGPFVI